MTSEKVRVVVGDDHPMFREGVVRALVSSGEIDVVAEAEDGLEALELIRTHQPQVALLDYRMPGMDGAEVAAAVTRDELPTRVLLVSAHDESAIVYKALQEGAAGFLPKESTRSELVSAVLRCAKGKDVIAPELAAGLASEIRRRNEPDVPALSPREREVLKLIAGGQQHSRHGQGAVPRAVDGQDPRATALREARRQRPRRRGGRGHAPQTAGLAADARSTTTVDNPFHSFIDYFAAEPVRVSAILRLPLIGLIAVLVWIWEVDHWLPELYAVILGVYAVAAVLWLIAVFRGPVPRWADWASTIVDLLVIVALCLVSGGATSALLPVFFLLPISVAFGDRPALTAIFGIVTAVGYLAVWIFYSKRDDRIGLPNIVYTHFGFLLWLAVATTALCFVLARRSLRVRALQEVRRQLVSEAMQADERRNREVAEHLHDGPLQTLLAARLELDEARERNPDPALDMVYEALQETATGLRSTVTRAAPAGAGPARAHTCAARDGEAVRVSHRRRRRRRPRGSG